MLLGLGALFLAACQRGRPTRVDLSCDIIRYDVTRDLRRLDGRPGGIRDSTLLARGHARLVVRGFTYADSTPLDRPFRVALTSTETGAGTGGESEVSRVLLELAAGGYSARVSCLGCSRADTVLRVPAGRVDTLDAYLTRFPTNCEPSRER